MSSFTPLRWGIIGCGSIANRLGNDVVHLEDHQLQAIASRDASKAAAYADHLDMRPPAESATWTSMLWEQYWRQRLAVCLVNYSYRMRSMIHSKAVGLATPALGASSRCRR